MFQTRGSAPWFLKSRLRQVSDPFLGMDYLRFELIYEQILDELCA